MVGGRLVNPETGPGYDAAPKRPRGRPRTLDYSVFDPLDVDPMALVQAVLRPPKRDKD